MKENKRKLIYFKNASKYLYNYSLKCKSEEYNGVFNVKRMLGLMIWMEYIHIYIYMGLRQGGRRKKIDSLFNLKIFNVLDYS